MSKERTRARLIQGTLKVLHKEGAAALTTGRIAESAGVAQPTFYVHFSGIEEALQNAADFVGERWVVGVRAARKAALDAGELDTVRSTLERYVAVLLAEPKLAELFLRHRRDTSFALGRSFRRLTDRARQELTNDLATVCHHTPGEIAPRMDLVLGVMFGVLETVLDRRSDRTTAIQSAVRMIEALLAASPGTAQAAE